MSLSWRAFSSEVSVTVIVTWTDEVAARISLPFPKTTKKKYAKVSAPAAIPATASDHQWTAAVRATDDRYGHLSVLRCRSYDTKFKS